MIWLVEAQPHSLDLRISQTSQTDFKFYLSSIEFTKVNIIGMVVTDPHAFASRPIKLLTVKTKDSLAEK